MAHKGEIGLRRGTVRLVAHHPKWAEYFNEEKQLLFKILGEKVLDIRHIGSTSISGIAAKPILDILAAVETLARRPGIHTRSEQNRLRGQGRWGCSWT